MQARGRLSFVHIRTSRHFKGAKPGDEPRYELNVLIPKEDEEQCAMIEQAVLDAKQEKWGERGLKKKMTGICWQDGDELDYDGCADHMVLKLARKADHGRPTIFGPKASDGEIDKDSPWEPYSGCYGVVEFNLYGSDAHSSNRVNGSLQGVQFWKHGPRLAGSAVSKPESFDDLPEEGNPFGDEEAEDAPAVDPALQ